MANFDWTMVSTLDADSALEKVGEARICDPVGAIGLFVTEAGSFETGFFWVADAAELASFLRHGLPCLYGMTDDDSDVGQLHAADDGLNRAEDRADGVTPVEVMAAFGAAYEGYCSFDWAGTWEELCSSDDEFAAATREQFYEERDDDAGEDLTRPISSEDLPDFQDYISHWGC